MAEVRSSLEYLLSQSQSQNFEHVLLTGGGAMAPGLTEALSRALSLPVNFAELGFEIDHKELGLDAQAISDASYRWLTAVGLSLWGTDVYGKASLLPAEILAKRQQQRIMVAAMAGVAVVAVALGGVSFAKINSAHSISNQIRTSQTEASALTRRIDSLGYVTKVPNEVKQTRALAIEALAGDINWTGLLQRITRSLPATVTVQSITLDKTEGAGPTGATLGAWLPRGRGDGPDVGPDDGRRSPGSEIHRQRVSGKRSTSIVGVIDDSLHRVHEHAGDSSGDDGSS